MVDDRRFDEMIKTLGGGGSRRAALKGAAAAALAGVLALRGSGASAAPGAERACREYTRRCETTNQCCGGKSACRRITKLDCNLNGRRCCGTRGAFCRDIGNCGCCQDLVCNPLTNRCDLPDPL